MNRDGQGHEDELKRATRKLRLLAQRLQVAQAERDEAIRRSRDVLSRRRVAELTEMTPGRVQQIIDRASR
jgi:hypothetical protein